MFMYVWGYGIMEMDGDGQQEEVGKKVYKLYNVCWEAWCLWRTHKAKEISGHGNRIGMKTKGQFRLGGHYLLSNICGFPSWEISADAVFHIHRSWRAQRWSGVRLLVYLKAYNKSVYVLIYTLENSDLWKVTYFLKQNGWGHPETCYTVSISWEGRKVVCILG